MITFDDVLRAFPEAHVYTPAIAAPFLEAANLGLPDSRFKGNAALADRARLNYVMHMLTKPALDLDAPHIRAQMGMPHPRIKKPHPWAGTKYGDALKKAVKV